MGTLISREGDMRQPLIKLGMDILFFIILEIPVIIFNLSDIQPSIRGFFCSDNNIRYPFRKSTVPSIALFLVGIPGVFAGTCTIECWHHNLNKPLKRGVFHPLLVALYRVFGYFIVGGAINQIVTDATKLTVGRLRPMFLDVCLPSVACNSTMEHVYVLDYTCTRTEYPGITESQFEDVLTDSRKSFPSGHASFSMYCAVFAVIYLELRLKYRPARMFKICCQTLAITAGIWCSCTRYVDNKHHPSDIIFGAIFGSTIGTFTAFFYYRSLTYPQRKNEKIRLCSVSPSAVVNGAVTLQVEPESNGISNELTLKADAENANL